MDGNATNYVLQNLELASISFERGLILFLTRPQSSIVFRRFP